MLQDILAAPLFFLCLCPPHHHFNVLTIKSQLPSFWKSVSGKGRRSLPCRAVSSPKITRYNIDTDRSHLKYLPFVSKFDCLASAPRLFMEYFNVHIKSYVELPFSVQNQGSSNLLSSVLYSFASPRVKHFCPRSKDHHLNSQIFYNDLGLLAAATSQWKHKRRPLAFCALVTDPNHSEKR